MVALGKAQSAGVRVESETRSTKMKASRNGHMITAGCSSSTRIAELSEMQPVSNGQCNVMLFNAGKVDSMKVEHRSMCQTGIGTCKRMEKVGALTGMDIFKLWDMLGSICEAYDDGKVTNAPTIDEKRAGNLC